jgi:serine/threonine protein kinase
VTGTDRHDEGHLIAGRYRLERRIGGGAMGVVWLAKDELLDRTIAVKLLLLSPGLSAEQAEQARKRSSREARIAARLQHRHAITVFDVAEDDGLPVLIMEYLPSNSLSEVLAARGALPPAEVARIGAHAASALAAAHGAGIVHRDVKPGNILLGEDGTTKITDFGISRAADDGTLTGSGGFAGTPAFLAPEAARGEKPSVASDVYSLGATLYTIVEGRFPYGDTENQMAMLYAAAAGRIRPPVQAGTLTGVLDRMMRLDPEERPAMAEVARELEGLSQPPERRRSRMPVYIGAAVVVVAAVVTTVLLLTSQGGNHAAAAPVVPSAPPAGSSQAATPAPAPSESAKAGAPSTKVSTSASTTMPASSAASTSTNSPATVSLTQAVSDYYAIMPGNPDVGWTKLGPDLQKQGIDVYRTWWSNVSNLVVVSAPKLVGQNTVEVVIDYTYKGERVQETHQLGMVIRDGRPLIDTDANVKSTQIG